ncbi:hypothetical protein ACFQ2T_12770 [Methylophilus flavus]|jgi:hypothetical protein|uniref:Exosortase-associated EpsI family protein n=1 Tax=Methylophilus flavus TaxID=640084 RepID=A0ABW3PFB5_9PROT
MKEILLFLLVTSWSGYVCAHEEPTLVFQIPSTFYQHPTRLSHPRVDYWHNRGKSAEKAGKGSFNAQHFKTSDCQTKPTGQALILIIPSMFYNLQRGVFYSEITAKIYTNPDQNSVLGKPLLTVKGQGQARGWVSYNAENFTHKSYQQAFDEVIQKLKKNTDYLQAIDNAPMHNYEALCQSIDSLAESKFY